MDLFERITLKRETIRAVIACPPQHGKTTLAIHGLVWGLIQRPGLAHAYVSYSASIAQEKLFTARLLAERVGLSGRFTLEKWLLDNGSQVRAVGVDGPLTGHAVNGLLLVDDYLKSRLEAESPTVRRKILLWFRSVASTRLHPGASCLVICTRWHPDDLGGELIREGWQSVILPAISEDGTALWPERRPLEFLLQQRRQIGEPDWWALYQGQPRPREGAIFRGVFTYTTPPDEGRTVIGLDFAYSAKTSADWSAAVALRQHEGKTYVLEVIREHVLPHTFAALLLELRQRYPRAEFVAGIASTERGTTALLRSAGLRVREVVLKADKWARAQRCAAAWSDGRILVPERTAPWVEPFLTEVLNFTGVGDKHDDQVDALTVGFSALDDQRIKIAPAVAGSRTWA